MMYDWALLSTLYRKLLALYPRGFREQLGESMEQTFNDLYKERQTEGGGSGFVLWMFVETTIGIVREHVLLFTEGDAMKIMLSNPRLAAVISFILCLPAAIIFLLNSIGVSQDFWTLSLSPEIMVTVAFLLLPVGLLVRGAPLRLPAIIGFLTMLPFMILELLNRVNRWNFNEDFPRIILFVMLWLLATLFSLTVTPIVRNVRAGNNVLSKPLALVLRVVFLAFLVWLWFGLVLDQMPCFLGVPNCD
jgi:hypothetical protein